MNTFVDMKKCPKLSKFYEKHCTSRTYFFQVRKCSDLNLFLSPLRGDDEITVFPDPVPTEVDGILHYQPDSDPSEKFLPSQLEDVEKNPHNIPFSPTANTAKNV